MDQFDNTIKALQIANEEHTLELCPNSSTLKFDGKSYVFSNGEKIETKYLNFIKRVKKEVIESANFMNLRDSIRPYYFDRNKTFSSDEKIFYGYIEIDINGAYWKTAEILGFISNETYKDGLSTPKKIRLVALGSAASMKDVLQWDTEKMEYFCRGQNYSKEGRNAFFAISFHVGELMRELIKYVPDMYLFFWVDAVVVHPAYANYTVEFFKDRGYECKLKELSFIRYSPPLTGKSPTFFCVEKKSENETLCQFDYKKFTFPNPGKRKKIKQFVSPKDQIKPYICK